MPDSPRVQGVLYVHLRDGTPDKAEAVLAELKTYFGDQQLRYQRVQVVPASFRLLASRLTRARARSKMPTRGEEQVYESDRANTLL